MWSVTIIEILLNIYQVHTLVIDWVRGQQQFWLTREPICCPKPQAEGNRSVRGSSKTAVVRKANMALDKPIREDRPWKGKENWRGDRAVDGRYTNRSAMGGQCVVSENYAQTATWGVDLENVVSISHIDIYYRTDNLPRPSSFTSRMAGFFLYVSNTTSKENGHLCFHEMQKEEDKPSLDQRINCSVHGRFVIYYNERKRPAVTYPTYYSEYAYYELCELEVYGCSNVGYYGQNCTIPCPTNCQERRCDVNTGQCLGCVPGYQGQDCSQVCAKQTYGSECSMSCGNCSNGDSCYHVDGTCLNGCSAGVQGETCTTECSHGAYGKNCMKNCSVNCNTTRLCDRFTGTCDRGCKAGWDGDKCTEKCGDDKYGSKCSQYCGKCKDGVTCHHVNGSCMDGCSPGYDGTLCQDKCADTFFGLKCAENCSFNCVNNTCHHETGECFVHKEELRNTSSERFQALSAIGGAIAGVLVLIVVIVFVIVYKRNRTERHQHKGQKTQAKTATNANPTTRSSFSSIYHNTDKADEKSEEVSRKQKTSKNHDRKFQDDDIDIDEKIHEENPYGDFYINEGTIPDIDVKNLSRIIDENSSNEDDGFKKEYATLLYGERYPCDIGKQPENLAKNRFKTTFPYDHSRVILTDSKQDYINANYIDGFREKSKYIASQGPKQNTLSEFWQMIWQENIQQVVMLTNLKEGTKDKCAQYWPEKHKNTTYGTFALRTEDEHIYANYIIRRIKVLHKKLNATRTITQYHYTAWPDHGIPYPICILLYHNHVARTKDPKHNGPILVHCSAGIGRTGTYIAIDELSDTVKNGRRKINIAEYVKKMRESRMNMVQTYEQYKTIFLTLHEMHKAPVNTRSPTEFVQELEAGTRDQLSNLSALRKEFQMLLSIRQHYSETDYKMATQNGDLSSSIRPLDRYVLYLTISVPGRGNYINAISVTSFVSPKAFILTKYPTPEDAVDFLRLIIDQESEVIVCMDPLRNIESTGKWLPDSGRQKTVVPFSMRLLEEYPGDVKRSKIDIAQDGNSNKYNVDIIEPSSDLTTAQPNTVLQIHKLVTFVKDIETEAPVIVISRDGAALCGVFCAVYNAVQQLTLDDEVDVFSVVRQLQIRRPELCSSLQEYEIIHDVMKRFIQLIESQGTENIYCNQ